MPYMLLILEPTGQRATRTREEGVQAYEAMGRFGQELQARGQLIASESLKSHQDAVRVQKRPGLPKAAQVIDGPFAEAKEMVGGFFLLNVDTRDEAIAIAERCPAAAWATVEVRALGPCFDDSNA